MNDIIHTLKKWADKKFGINIQNHQLTRIYSDLQRILNKKVMTESAFLSGLANEEKEVIDIAIDVLTVQESYFFRDASLFYFLRDKVIPSIILEKVKKNNKKLTVWSAGCAYGEEIYSIAILLYELLPDFDTWDIKLVGTDINDMAILKAKKANYRAISLRTLDDKTKNKYFICKDSLSYSLKDKIKKNVSFGYYNLASDRPLNYQFDIILCRNVFIYLTPEIIEKALNNFKKHLTDNGFLFLGASDFVSYVNHGFKQQFSHGVNFFSKGESQDVIELDNKKELINEVSYIKQQQQRSLLIQAIKEAIDQKQYHSVIMKVDNFINIFGENSLLLQYKVESLIHLNDIKTAKEMINKALSIDRKNPKIYFMRGLILMDEKRNNEAYDCFNRTIQLKPNFFEAYYYLGILKIRNKQLKEGLIFLNQAKEIAMNKKEDEQVIFSDISLKEYIRSIESEITYYKKLCDNYE